MDFFKSKNCVILIISKLKNIFHGNHCWHCLICALKQNRINLLLFSLKKLKKKKTKCEKGGRILCFITNHRILKHKIFHSQISASSYWAWWLLSWCQAEEFGCFPIYLTIYSILGHQEIQATVCVLSRFSCVQLFPTPWTVACQAAVATGFSRQEYWSGLPCPPPGDLPNPRIKPESLMSPALAGGFFTTWEAPAKTSSERLDLESWQQLFEQDP